MFDERLKTVFYWALGLIVTVAIALIFYSKEQEIKKLQSENASNCVDFHAGTFVYYFNGSKKGKKIIIDGDTHLEYENDSNWIKI